MPRNPALRPVAAVTKIAAHREGNARFIEALPNLSRALQWLTDMGMPIIAVAIPRTGPVIHVCPSNALRAKLDDVIDIGQTNCGGLIKRRYGSRRFDVSIQWEELQ